MSKHTEGPWFVVGKAGYEALEIWTKARRVAKSLYHGGSEDDEADANAYLIAAAPDLLAALEKAMDVIERLGGERGIGRMGAALDAIDAALAKAEGES